MSDQQVPPTYGQYPTQSSGAAITSLIFGILTHLAGVFFACPTMLITYGVGAWVCLPLLMAGWITALITGYVGRRNIRANQGRLTGDGAAVAGIVLGWIGVGLTVLVVILTIVLAAFGVLAVVLAELTS